MISLITAGPLPAAGNLRHPEDLSVFNSQTHRYMVGSSVVVWHKVQTEGLKPPSLVNGMGNRGLTKHLD